MEMADFSPILDHLIASAPKENQDGVECQVTLTNGAMIAGALYKPKMPGEGFYALRAIMRKSDARTGPPTLVDFLFHGKGVFVVTLPTGETVETPRIVVPTGMPSRMG